MKIKILGAASGIPDPDLHHASLWIEIEETQILFDCGEGTAKQLIRNNLAGNTIDAIVISHFHPDHVSGIYMVLQMLYLQKRTKKLDIFLPERTVDFKQILEFHYLFTEKFAYLVNIWDMEELNTRYHQISALPTDHLLSYKILIERNSFENTMRSYAFLIKEAGKLIIYTSDVSQIDFLKHYLPKLDLLIIDALHPEPEAIKDVCEKTDVKVILNHGLAPALIEHVKSNPDIFIKAEENEEIIV